MQITITNTRKAVITKAKKLFFSNVVETWSEAMVLAWKVVKFKNRIAQGLPVQFLKVSGEIRTVQAPALYSNSTQSGSGKKAPASSFVFLDTKREGSQVISCKIANIII